VRAERVASADFALGNGFALMRSGARADSDNMRTPLSFALPDAVRVSDLLSALSFALDLTEGQPMGHALRSCLIGMLIADRAQLTLSERRDLYYARSPIHFLDRMARPLILFQGLEDKIVPPNQAELLCEAVRAKGLPVAYLAYPGEQHGFRRAENIKRTLEA